MRIKDELFNNCICTVKESEGRSRAADSATLPCKAC